MPRIRSIKPEFFASETLAGLPHRTRITFEGLWVYCDDQGRGLDNPRLIKAVVWPVDDDIGLAEIKEDLMLLNTVITTKGEAGLILRYTKNGLKCIAIRNWREHQRVSHPRKSRMPPPPARSRKPPEASRLPLDDLRPEVEVGSGSRNREVEQGGGARGGGAKGEGNGRVQAPGSKSKAKTKRKTPAGKVLDDLERKRARDLTAEAEAKRASS